MTATSHSNGHEVLFIDGRWVYEDDLSLCDHERECLFCGRESAMCKWGTNTDVDICKPTPVQKRTSVKVDECIAPLVQMLNDYGVETTASCCGHGKAKGRIDLVDGQIIWIPVLHAIAV